MQACGVELEAGEILPGVVEEDEAAELVGAEEHLAERIHHLAVGVGGHAIRVGGGPGRWWSCVRGCVLGSVPMLGPGRRCPGQACGRIGAEKPGHGARHAGHGLGRIRKLARRRHGARVGCGPQGGGAPGGGGVCRAGCPAVAVFAGCAAPEEMAQPDPDHQAADQRRADRQRRGRKRLDQRDLRATRGRRGQREARPEPCLESALAEQVGRDDGAHLVSGGDRAGRTVFLAVGPALYSTEPAAGRW